ncbi:hypothetical protein [Streptomyces globisporus]|uniref:Uncharacterized protein n=1 Tax=Streptomyces globisporus TaxID=1908 RepID=A0A423UWY1_STRGL|nr:hypothetical protein [Streptomyces globisporus]ROV66767.1 hypothetical protein D3105_20285 [Streptomyces globisporus]
MPSASPRPAARRNDSPAAGFGRPLGGPWLVPGYDGRLTAYVSVRDAVLRWTQNTVGGDRWQGPEVLPAKGVTHVSVVHGENRYAHFLGLRTRPTGDGWSRVDVMYATQYQTARPMTQWHALGNPHKDIGTAGEVGAPTGVVTSDGALHVCVPTGSGSVELRREDAKGAWGAWKSLPAAGATDAPVPAATSTGLVEVLVPTRVSALYLRQAKTGAALEPAEAAGVVPVPGSATPLETGPGRITYYLTDAGGGGVVALRPGSWPLPLGGAPADGRIAALRTSLDGFDCTVLAVRGITGTVNLGVCATEDEQSGVWWTDTAMRCQGDPSIARDGEGRLVVAVLDTEGRPTAARQEDGPGLTLSDWRLI